MAKTIVKEIIIVLLLCLAIILVLGILLYEYVPISKTVPNPVSYTTPQDAKEELANSESVDEDTIVMTYETDATDLSNYKKINNYQPGKANPFSSYETNGTTTGSGSSTGTGSSTGNTNSSSGGNGTSGTTNNSDEGYFPNTGTK